MDLLREAGRRSANGLTGLLLHCQKRALIGAGDLWPLTCASSDRECVSRKVASGAATGAGPARAAAAAG